MGIAMAAVLVLVFVGVFVVLPPASTPFVGAPEANLAATLANQMKSLPTVGDQTCWGVSSVVANTLTILQDMDRTTGTAFGTFQFDASNCDVVAQYLPLLGTYDALILASRSLDPNNVTSVKVFYEGVFLLSSDFIIINDRVAYNIAFKSTGDLNDALGLAKLRSICGDDCYRGVLSGIHWTIRVYMDQFLCQFEGWASKYVQLIPYTSC
jgi:hypothetical protein